MSKSFYRPGNSAKYLKVEKHCNPNHSVKRIRRKKIEVSTDKDIDITIHFNLCGLLASAFVYLEAPLPLTWKAILILMILFCSLSAHDNKEN